MTGVESHWELFQLLVLRISSNDFCVFQIYDKKLDSWYESVPMKQHRVHLAVAGFNGELYATGGIGKRPSGLRT